MIEQVDTISDSLGSPPIVGGQVPPIGDLPLPQGFGALPANADIPSTPMEIFHTTISVFVVAFLVTLFVTPLMRQLALRNGVVDMPSDSRKMHSTPIAYLGGVAIFIGMMAAIAFTYIEPDLEPRIDLIGTHLSAYDQMSIPFSIVLGMMLIMLTGLLDDVTQLSPRIKIGGQLIAAAALAMNNIGTTVAAGVLQPIGKLIGNTTLTWEFAVPFFNTTAHVDLIYWTGVVIIALFVLGACNASNLIDGLDGLCTGVTSIALGALLIIALLMAAADTGHLDGARVTLCLAALGATLGFLPFNYKPANIFLGDAGSMLLGYITIVLILSLGDTGKTHFVVSGLVIYAIPIIDTTLAMVRRRLQHRPMSEADDQHLHHMLQRWLGVHGAVLSLYGLALLFGALGVWLTFGRVRVVMTFALVLASFIGVTAVKLVRRQLSAEPAAMPASAAHGRSDPDPQQPPRPVSPTRGSKPRKPEPV